MRHFPNTKFPKKPPGKDPVHQKKKKKKLALQQLSIKKATTDDKVPGYLEYVTKFPKGHSFDFLIYDLFISVLFIAVV